MSSKKIKQIIEAGIEDRYEEGSCFAEIVNNAQTEEEKVVFIKFIIENAGIISKTGIPVPKTGRKMSSDRWRELRRLEGKIIDAQIERAFLSFPTLEEAAKMILKIYESQPDDEMRDFLIANVVADKRIPYIEVPGAESAVKMDNQQFQTLSKRLLKQIRQIQYVLRDADFEQRSEQASILLAILNTAQDPTERVVLMTNIILLQKFEYDQALKRIQERL